MRITVVGGNKGTGAHVVRIAAQGGHQVTCLSRSGATSLPEGVRDIKGDALQAEVVRATGTYVVQGTGERRPMKGMISRADVAAHIVSILDDPDTFGRALAMGTA